MLLYDGARGRQVWVLAAVPPRGAPRLRGAVGAAAHAEAAALALRGGRTYYVSTQ